MSNQEQRIQDMRELGLSDDEIKYMITPLSKLSPNQRITVIAVDDRRRKLIRAANEEWMRQQAEAKTLAGAEGEIEADFSTDNMHVVSTEAGIPAGAYGG